MKHNKQGSTLLTILLLLTVVVSGMQLLYKRFSLSHELVLQKKEHVRRSFVSKGVLRAGVAWSIDHFEDLIKKEKQTQEDFGIWSPDSIHTYNATVTVTPKNNALHVQAAVQPEHVQKTFLSSCVIQKKSDADGRDMFEIQDWQESC